MYTLDYFKKLILLIFIWQIIVFIPRLDIHNWRLPRSLTDRVWNVVNESNVDSMNPMLIYYETTISTWDTGESSTTETTTIPVFSNAKESPVNIVLWTRFHTNRNNRLKWMESLVQKMRKDICFEDCKVSMSGNQSNAKAADAIVFFPHREGIKQEMLPLRTTWNQIWVYMQHEPPVHYRPGAHLNSVFNWTMTYRMDSDIYNPYYRFFPLAKSLKPTDPLRFGNRQYNLSEWVDGKTMHAVAVISNCGAVSKRLAILRKLQSSGIPIDIYGRCGNKSIPTPEDAFWNEVGRKYRFYFAMENSICSDYVTEKFWRPMELGMVPIVMGRARYSDIAPPLSFIDMKDFPNPNDLKKYLRFLANHPKAYLEFFEWRRHYNVVRSVWDLCDLCAKLKQHKRRLKKDDHYEYTAHMNLNLTRWWNSAPGKPNLPACISPEEFGFRKYLQKTSTVGFSSKSKPIKQKGIIDRKGPLRYKDV